ncbi:P-loop NTPase fold protein, partial [Clostridium perfringens]
MIDFFRYFFRDLKLKFREKDEDNDIKVLSPNEDIPKDDIYIESLLKAIKHKKALNIALSGPYGAGKSSIIESFKKHYKEFNCINIS